MSGGRIRPAMSLNDALICLYLLYAFVYQPVTRKRVGILKPYHGRQGFLGLDEAGNMELTQAAVRTSGSVIYGRHDS